MWGEEEQNLAYLLQFASFLMKTFHYFDIIYGTVILYLL